MNFILFGPPGIGKSTIIGQLKLKGVKAIDLEDIYPNNLRFSIPTLLDGVVFGGADLDPKKDYGPNVMKILITRRDQTSYERQREQRDHKYPEKASQNKHILSDWTRGVKYDWIYYIPHFHTSPGESAGTIKSFVKSHSSQGKEGNQNV